MDPNVCQLRITIYTKKKTRKTNPADGGTGMTRKLPADVHGPQMHDETREKRTQEETH